ncbi:MAG: hypothetical protein HPM95_13000 [Alphaproteobacteria bacterium]|nr:hypothetical protein [Alphaproteobacteria bacterium]
MPEFALTKDGTSISEVRMFDVRPPDPAANSKPWHWLEVQRVDGEPGGWEIDLANGVAVYRRPSSAAQVRRDGSFREFMGLFSQAEKLAIVNAKKTDAQLELWLMEAGGAEFVSLDDDTLITGMGYLVAQGLLTSARAAEILGADFDAQT